MPFLFGPDFTIEDALMPFLFGPDAPESGEQPNPSINRQLLINRINRVFILFPSFLLV
jgi:hypothetical protein